MEEAVECQLPRGEKAFELEVGTSSGTRELWGLRHQYAASFSVIRSTSLKEADLAWEEELDVYPLRLRRQLNFCWPSVP